MKLIAETFNSRFDHWGIVLPEEDMQNRSGGYIQNAGWLIQYCFGNDDHGEYLDYYAAHRMTDDEHVRIYEDGQVKNLPALRSMRLVSMIRWKISGLKMNITRKISRLPRCWLKKVLTSSPSTCFSMPGWIKKQNRYRRKPLEAYASHEHILLNH